MPLLQPTFITKKIARLIVIACAVILTGCTISIEPSLDNNLSVRIGALEEQGNQLEPVQTPALSDCPLPPDEVCKKVLDIRGLDQDGQPTSTLIKTDKLLSFPGLNESSEVILTETFADNAQLEYALLYSGEGTDWHLYHTQPLTEIITVTQVAAYRESEQDRATLRMGPRFSVSGATLIPPPPNRTLSWQEAIGDIQNVIGDNPPLSGRIFTPATAFLVISEELAGKRSSTLIVFWGISPDGTEVAPNGTGDLFAACDNCSRGNCPFWCALIQPFR